MLDGLVDESDPDVDFPNSFHAFQTAEGIRKAHPDKGVLPRLPGVLGAWPCPPPRPSPSSALGPASPLQPALASLPDWFHLVGLLHDLGKVLVLAGEPQVRSGERGAQGGALGGLGPGVWTPLDGQASRAHPQPPVPPVGRRWRHLPCGLPSAGLCGFLRLYLPG